LIGLANKAFVCLFVGTRLVSHILT